MKKNIVIVVLFVLLCLALVLPVTAGDSTEGDAVVCVADNVCYLETNRHLKLYCKNPMVDSLIVSSDSGENLVEIDCRHWVTGK